MRHLWSLLAGLVIAPLTWVLLAYANGGLYVAAQLQDTDRLVVPSIIIAVAGLIVGSIASLRISPMGPFFGGLLLISISVLGLAVPDALNDALPDLPEIGDIRGALILPVGSGSLLLVGTILIFGVFSGQRWRMWPTSKLHPTVGPVNPMIDTGRIEAIKSWSPGESTGSTPTTVTPKITDPVLYTPEPSTSPIAAGKHSSIDKTETDGASPWAVPPTDR